MINFVSVYDLVSGHFMASKPLNLESQYTLALSKISQKTGKLKEEGSDRLVIKTEKKEVIYAIVFDGIILMAVTIYPQNHTQVLWIYQMMRNIKTEVMKPINKKTPYLILKNYVENSMIETNKSINISVIFPERRPPSDPNLEIETEKWESVIQTIEILDSPTSNKPSPIEKINLQSTLVIIGIFLILVGVVLVLKTGKE